jgi:hypothetical protein
MKQLMVSHLKNIKYNDVIETVSLRLNELEKHALNYTPWAAYPYKPGVQFVIAHSNDCIFLKIFC